jgi:hypothetical protein
MNWTEIVHDNEGINHSYIYHSGTSRVDTQIPVPLPAPPEALDRCTGHRGASGRPATRGTIPCHRFYDHSGEGIKLLKTEPRVLHQLRCPHCHSPR